MKSKKILAAVLVVTFLVTAGGSFWLGTYYQQWSQMNQFRQFAAGNGQGQPPGMPTGQGVPNRNQQGMPSGKADGEMGLTGKVDKIDSNTITITARMGSQKIEITADLKVNKPSLGSINDIKKGTEIFVQGKRNDSGKIEAEKIQIISD